MADEPRTYREARRLAAERRAAMTPEELARVEWVDPLAEAEAEAARIRSSGPGRREWAEAGGIPAPPRE